MGVDREEKKVPRHEKQKPSIPEGFGKRDLPLLMLSRCELTEARRANNS